MDVDLHPNALPRMRRIRQDFPRPVPLDIPAAVARAFVPLRPGLKPGARVAVGVGSRGINHLATIVAAVIAQLRHAGAVPFILPAMGSHGGATPDGAAGDSGGLWHHGGGVGRAGAPVAGCPPDWHDR